MPDVKGDADMNGPGSVPLESSRRRGRDTCGPYIIQIQDGVCGPRRKWFGTTRRPGEDCVEDASLSFLYDEAILAGSFGGTIIRSCSL